MFVFWDTFYLVYVLSINIKEVLIVYVLSINIKKVLIVSSKLVSMELGKIIINLRKDTM